MPTKARDYSVVLIASVAAGAILLGTVLGWLPVILGTGIAIALHVLHRSSTSTSTGQPIPDGGSQDIELVVAIIRPGKLNVVKQALAEAGAPSLTVTNVSGRGTQPNETGRWRGEEYIVDLHQKVKVECAVTDDQTATVIDAISDAASTGEPGDGKIFVLPIYDACRVSTGERGLEAM